MSFMSFCRVLNIYGLYDCNVKEKKRKQTANSNLHERSNDLFNRNKIDKVWIKLYSRLFLKDWIVELSQKFENPEN